MPSPHHSGYSSCKPPKTIISSCKYLLYDSITINFIILGYILLQNPRNPLDTYIIKRALNKASNTYANILTQGCHNTGYRYSCKFLRYVCPIYKQ